MNEYGVYLFATRGVRHEVLVAAVDTNHGFAETARDFRDNLRIVVVRDGLDDGARALGRIARLEDTRTHEDAIHTELHHQSGVGWSGDTTSGEVDDRQTTELSRLLDEFERGADFLGVHEDFILVHGA